MSARFGARLAGLAWCGAWLAACVGAPAPDQERSQRLSDSRSQFIQVNGRPLHWVETGPASAPPILFIHGTPGSWTAFVDYLDHSALASAYRLISVDRPGFGESDAGQIEPSLQRQAAAIAHVLRDAPPAVLVGHSLGGPIALRLAADFPERVRGVLLVAASLDPALEAPRWYNHLAAAWPVRWMTPPTLRWANREVMVLQDELHQLATVWDRIRAPISLIQGMDDRLVYPGNADYAEARMPPEQLRVLRLRDAGHFVLWKQVDTVVGELRQLLRDTEAGTG